MKITISGSTKKLHELEQVGDQLRKRGFEVKTPVCSNYHLGDYKLRRQLMDEHLEFIKNADVFLIGNVKTAAEKFGRVGTSTYFETGWAYALGKPIFALEKIDPESDFAEDLLALDVKVLYSIFNKIKETK
jgi:nucleoside 2-deoxyribosyltransferase